MAKEKEEKKPEKKPSKTPEQIEAEKAAKIAKKAEMAAKAKEGGEQKAAEEAESDRLGNREILENYLAAPVDSATLVLVVTTVVIAVWYRSVVDLEWVTDRMIAAYAIRGTATAEDLLPTAPPGP